LKSLKTENSLRLFMQRVLTAETAEFFEFQTLRGLLFILVRHVIAILAIATLQNDIVSHNRFSVLSFQFLIFSFQPEHVDG
jgi:hypothetical protein